MDDMRGKVASILALIIGVMAVVAGGGVLLGRDPGYSVIGWLPIYNVAAGAFTALITAILIWRRHRLAVPFTATTLGLHVVVMLFLLTAYRGTAASQSLVAMAIRIAVWVGILALLWDWRKPDRIGSTSRG
jgi:ABC-type enterobactin transport system permease subunit